MEAIQAPRPPRATTRIRGGRWLRAQARCAPVNADAESGLGRSTGHHVNALASALSAFIRLANQGTAAWPGELSKFSDRVVPSKQPTDRTNAILSHVGEVQGRAGVRVTTRRASSAVVLAWATLSSSNAATEELLCRTILFVPENNDEVLFKFRKFLFQLRQERVGIIRIHFSPA
jgi:hypothetical protein